MERGPAVLLIQRKECLVIDLDVEAHRVDEIVHRQRRRGRGIRRYRRYHEYERRQMTLREDACGGEIDREEAVFASRAVRVPDSVLNWSRLTVKDRPFSPLGIAAEPDWRKDTGDQKLGCGLLKLLLAVFQAAQQRRRWR